MKTLVASLLLASTANAALFTLTPRSSYFRSGGSAVRLGLGGVNFGGFGDFSWEGTPVIAVEGAAVSVALTELNYTMQFGDSRQLMASVFPVGGVYVQLTLDPITTPGPRLVAPASQTPPNTPSNLRSFRTDFTSSIEFELPTSFPASGSLVVRVSDVTHTFPVATLFTLADPANNILPLEIPLSLRNGGTYMHPLVESPRVTYAPAAGSDFVQTVAGVPIALRWTNISLPIYQGGTAPEPTGGILAGIAALALRGRRRPVGASPRRTCRKSPGRLGANPGASCAIGF